MGAKYEVRGHVAVITLDNPPVNGLGYDTRTGIASGVSQAMADQAVVAVVITGGGRAFRAVPTSRNSATQRRVQSQAC